MRSGTPVRKGRIDPLPYIEKAKLARVSILPPPRDIAREVGGQRCDKHSAPLPFHLQVDSDKLRRASRRTKRKLRELERSINPAPAFKVVGPFKIY